MAANACEGMNLVQNIKGLVKGSKEEKNIDLKLKDLELREVEIIDDLYQGHFRAAPNHKQATSKKLASDDPNN